MTVDLLPPLALFFVLVMHAVATTSDNHRRTRTLAILDDYPQRLSARLRAYAVQAGIEVYRSSHDYLKRLTGQSTAGGYCHQLKVIALVDDHWIVLAHELGHHHAITYYGDATEEAADREATRIAYLCLTEEERDVVWAPIVRDLFDEARKRVVEPAKIA